MRRFLDNYDEDRVAAISAEIAAAVDSATLGGGSWDEVPALLSRAFPGSWGGLYNMNFPHSRLNFLTFQNLEPAEIKSFAEHFAYINPWAAYWTACSSTTITASEDTYPARWFAKSEFYNDWLIRQNKAEAAVGMKLVGELDEAIHFLVHFPLSSAGTYQRAALEIITRTRGSFERSVNLMRRLRTDGESAVVEAALLERAGYAAFVVDGGRLLIEANPMAERLFSSGQCVAVRNRRCHIVDKDADTLFGAALEKLSRGMPTLTSRTAFRTASGTWQVSVAAIPLSQAPSPGIVSVLPPRRLVLVLMVDLSPRHADAADLTSLSTLFGLTPSETAFCRRLLLGESVTDAASQLGITEGTARTRLKAILRKTDTSRQGELMLLLSRAR